MVPTPDEPIDFPRPSDRPEADIVLYDGACNFCRSQMRQLQWWDCQGKLAYLSIHDAEVAQRWSELPRERLLQEMCVVDPEGGQHWGAEAIRYLTRRLRRLWWLAPLTHFPGAMTFGRPLYRFIANNRYLIGGKSECESRSCSLHR